MDPDYKSAITGSPEVNRSASAKDDWDRAHQCVQGHEGEKDCDLVHAHLHRVEGDLSNAGYWYRRAGRSAATSPLPEEWSAIATALLAKD